MTISEMPLAPDSFKKRHHDAAWAVLERFATGLADKARSQGNAISVEDIHKALVSLKAQPNLFDDAWHALETEVTAANARRTPSIRNDPFGRLLVSRFAHLLEGREAGDLEHGALSREMLHPFFQVIRMMVGADTIEQIDSEIRAIVDTHAHEEDEMRDATDYWDHLSANPLVSKQITMVFVRMAMHFADYQKRKNWFIQLVNDNIHRNGSSWEFTEDHFIKLIHAMFRDVRTILSSPERSALLAAEIDHDKVAVLRRVMAHLDRDIAALHNREAAAWQNDGPA
ncbi:MULTISPECIES: hypothetical protein [unclassified Thalassospira]|uniref:hypothetical protein n=1 Tax=unclassified Thalassospira TaxID=2648997 RepID=UPI000A1DA4FA|nr:hypothetical protein [Thalassospira sp. MCCC 1A01428]OSQ44136.1 hypothetical protein THS27_07925 [Thalassospira sp. MCCC 1A01428]